MHINRNDRQLAHPEGLAMFARPASTAIKVRDRALPPHSIRAEVWSGCCLALVSLALIEQWFPL